MRNGNPFKDTVLQEFPSVGRYKVRLLKPDENSLPVVDIREYVTGGSFEGFTRRGIKLTSDQIPGLASTLETIARMLATSGRSA
jgi:hypothetical protein